MDVAYIYVDDVNNNLTCCICYAPFIDPTTIRTCGHTFCQRCITTAISHVKQCPVDRSPVTLSDLSPASQVVRSLVDELVVECPKRSFGCTHTCQRHLVASHLREKCQFVESHCCEEACGQVLLKKDTIRHSKTCRHRIIACPACGTGVKYLKAAEHVQTCPVKEIECQACALLIPRVNLEAHHGECPDHIIPCDHSAFGCAWQGKRSDLSATHRLTCPYYSLRGFFALYETQKNQAEAKEAEMAVEIEQLKATVRAQRRDLDAAKASLGPWFKPDGSPSPSTTPTIERAVPILDRPPRRRLSTPLNTGPFNFPLPDPEDGSSSSSSSSRRQSIDEPRSPRSSMDRPPFSSYAPPTSPDLTPAPPLPLFLHGDGPASFPRPPPQSQVAPVNRDTTLEGCVTSLRNSIVNLAGSLDSLSRRQDMMLTTESLRMYEEVAAIRAIVHGLRMQVHKIMMERNAQAMRMASSSPYSTAGPSEESMDQGFGTTVEYINHSMTIPSSLFGIQSSKSSFRRAFENKL